MENRLVIARGGAGMSVAIKGNLRNPCDVEVFCILPVSISTSQL